MAYRDARPCLPAGRVNGLVIRACARGPPAAISFSVRQTVGTEATGPVTSRNPPRTAKSLITSAPPAIAAARSASTRPRSWISSRGVARAFDRSAVRPVLSASDRSKTSPVCDTIPLPPEVTSRPRDHPGNVHVEGAPQLGSDKGFDTLIVPAQEHLQQSTRRSVRTRDEKPGLGHVALGDVAGLSWLCLSSVVGFAVYMP